MNIKTCQICEKSFIPKCYNASLCSKECRKIKRKSYTNKEQKLLYDIEYRKKNIKRYKEIKGDYYQKNKNKIKDYQAEYLIKNKEVIKIRTKKYRDKRKEKKRLYDIEYRNKNREKKLITDRLYYENNKEDLLAKYKIYRQKTKDKIKLRFKERYRNDIQFRITNILRKRIGEVLKNQKTIKSAKTLELLGCSLQEFKGHLHKQFKEGMTWDNYGLYGWHIDHILPCASFDLTDIEQQKKCFHYTNLQPLWAKENLSKGKKIITQGIILPPTFL
jgi:hypothetical protein